MNFHRKNKFCRLTLKIIITHCYIFTLNYCGFPIICLKGILFEIKTHLNHVKIQSAHLKLKNKKFTFRLTTIWWRPCINLGMIGVREKVSGRIFSFLYFSLTFENIVQNNSRPESTLSKFSLFIHSIIYFKELAHKSTPSKLIISVIISAYFI